MKTASTPVTLTVLLLASASSLAAPIGQVQQGNQPAVQLRQLRGTDGGAVVFGRSQDDQPPPGLPAYAGSLLFGGVDRNPRGNTATPDGLTLTNVSEGALGEKKSGEGSPSEVSSPKGGVAGDQSLKKQGTTTKGLDNETAPQKQEAKEEEDGKEQQEGGQEKDTKTSVEQVEKESTGEKDTKKQGSQAQQESIQKEGSEQENSKEEGTEQRQTDKQGSEVRDANSKNTEQEKTTKGETEKEGDKKEDSDEEKNKEEGSKTEGSKGKATEKDDDDDSKKEKKKQADDDDDGNTKEAETEEASEKKTSSKEGTKAEDANTAEDSSKKESEKAEKASKATAVEDQSDKKDGGQESPSAKPELLKKRSVPLRLRSYDYQHGTGRRSDPGEVGALLPPGRGESGGLGGPASSLTARGGQDMGEIRGAVGRAVRGLHPHP
ncbi:hypothetical protein BCV69DRAFT_305870 [Microstroma glucosiphilum]|uniref:Uncharacterized protein n=1 Tax=Pseudomicrostroma glucosiphilum TaxID=1684307 RepID=A0A316UDP0_9BASI|nr:hypothetical protein BCV69DRAFT_305870 [Pseudomicrostroma glucosiphilum]PWN23326.1 hypothetical protein BCV69DRAFT_305870 [Pseudomicrostroma glucosiphilum]